MRRGPRGGTADAEASASGGGGGDATPRSSSHARARTFSASHQAAGAYVLIAARGSINTIGPGSELGEDGASALPGGALVMQQLPDTRTRPPGVPESSPGGGRETKMKG